MLPKINWTSSLRIGITSTLLLVSCVVITEYAVTGTYVFVNETGHSINIGGEYLLKPKGTFTKMISIPSGKDPKPLERYPVPMRGWHGLSYIVFDDSRCSEKLVVETNAEYKYEYKGVYDIKNYQVEKINDYWYKFTYRFTEKDYEASTPCTAINILDLVFVNETDSHVGIAGTIDGMDNAFVSGNILPKDKITYKRPYLKSDAATSHDRYIGMRSEDGNDRYGISLSGEQATRIFFGFRPRIVEGWGWDFNYSTRSRELNNGQRCLVFPPGDGPILENLEKPEFFEKEVVSENHVRYTYRITKALENRAVPCASIQWKR